MSTEAHKREPTVTGLLQSSEEVACQEAPHTIAVARASPDYSDRRHFRRTGHGFSTGGNEIGAEGQG
jgi:hypothetical protein